MRVLACAAVAVGATVAMTGCGSTDAVSTDPDGAHLFWALRASAGAAMMDAGSTLQLSAVALYPTGDTIRDLPAPTFRSADVTKVTVSPTGLLTAVAATTSAAVPVISSLKVGPVTNVDTTFVFVTPVRRTVARLTLLAKGSAVSDTVPLNNGDSLRVSLRSSYAMSARFVDSAGLVVNGATVRYRSMNQLTVSFFSTTLTAAAKGQTKFVASSVLYGVPVADTITANVGNPMALTISVVPLNVQFGNPVLNPITTVIGVGGVVTWAFSGLAGTSTDIVFLQNPDTAGIKDAIGLVPNPFPPPLVPLNQAVRTFTTIGQYLFKVTATGDTGRVVVIPND